MVEEIPNYTIKKNKCLHILLVHTNKYNKCIKENKSIEDFLIIGACRVGFLIMIKYIYNQKMLHKINYLKENAYISL